MKIIEKLGITPGPWSIQKEGCFDDFYIGTKEDEMCCYAYDKKEAQLIATAPEMLEALIDGVIVIFNSNTVMKSAIQANTVRVIEKATGNTWDEIKELLK